MYQRRTLSTLASATLLVATLATLLTTAPAQASPWTLPQDELAFAVSYNFQIANSEYLPDGHHQIFPLEGSSLSQGIQLTTRYGFTDRFEGAVDLSFKQVTYQALPLILGAPDDPSQLSGWNDAIIDFNTARTGMADVYFYGRYNLRRGLIMITSETSAKLPTGYQAPEGTFDEDTGLVAGQATLGDGQADITQSILFGAYLPATGGFARLDLGARLRFGSPGNQLVGGAKIGQPLNPTTVLFAGARGHFTINQGEVIGTTLVARDPSIPRSEFTGANIIPIPLRLDSDELVLEGGVLFRIATIEIVANYGYTIWGQNTAATHTFSIGTGYSIANATATTEEY